ncbi:S1C family serine protease [Nocardia cyriacigeorgica]|jgi:S1-C subfamily serine protease|uniref:S1C family serine protease n=1 Tax=Nocardia cyriacigeorgica TaxID=135487 RepID=UPI001895B88C|nr:trypsin-like peptidase domain-containing protein [Nocardia cyriacigeorgica]MBF6437310.1 trypsin-like peptidase domain-containing protein [Nocardia cyriacigeorgica]MBF6452879.1 trypsin-like peptidase domain-containing protein [Nocardia cyriacigeorgica]MBF6479634.1 trypsin-like peptidase domain-containing protein [Nocardia cyriacigeorgica]MBF6550048.1 trypsin-like peptidase domain-containing protein [Nocardia cyriacigeorgica]
MDGDRHDSRDDLRDDHPRRRGGAGRLGAAVVATVLAVAAFLGYRGELPGWPSLERIPAAAPAVVAPRPPLDPVAVAAGIEPVLVNINVATKPFGVGAAGSGIVLTADGQVLTSHHVVKGAESVKVTRVSDGLVYDAQVLGYDSSTDIALLGLVGATGLTTARLGSSSGLRVRDEVLAIGNAGGTGEPTAVAGRISDLDSTILALNSADLSRKALSGMVEVSAEVSSGQSGGALADHSGAVVGVIAAASGDQEDEEPGVRAQRPPVGYAVPIDTAMRVVRQIRSGTPTETVHVGPTATLGVLISDAKPSGARVDVAIYGLPAHNAGLADGEVITSIDGKIVTSARALRAAINKHRPHDIVELGVSGPGGQRTVRVVLAPGTPN